MKVVTSFRIEKKLKDRICKEAKKSNLTMSEYINRQLKNKSIVVLEYGKEIYYELNKIGNNINQIAKKLNSNIATNKDIAKLENISNVLNNLWQSLNSLK